MACTNRKNGYKRGNEHMQVRAGGNQGLTNGNKYKKNGDRLGTDRSASKHLLTTQTALDKEVGKMAVQLHMVQLHMGQENVKYGKGITRKDNRQTVTTRGWGWVGSRPVGVERGGGSQTRREGKATRMIQDTQGRVMSKNT